VAIDQRGDLNDADHYQPMPPRLKHPGGVNPFIRPDLIFFMVFVLLFVGRTE